MPTKRMEDSWSRIKNHIMSTWGEDEFTDKELKKARGSLPQMVSLIHEKTGENRGMIIQKLNAVI